MLVLSEAPNVRFSPSTILYLWDRTVTARRALSRASVLRAEVERRRNILGQFQFSFPREVSTDCGANKGWLHSRLSPPWNGRLTFLPLHSRRLWFFLPVKVILMGLSYLDKYFKRQGGIKINPIQNWFVTPHWAWDSAV